MHDGEVKVLPREFKFLPDRSSRSSAHNNLSPFLQHGAMSDDEEALLEASRVAYQTKSKRSKPFLDNEEAFVDGADMIKLDDDDDGAHSHEPKPRRPSKGLSARKLSKKKLVEPSDLTESALKALEVTPSTKPRKRSKREIEEVCMLRSLLVPCQVGRLAMVWNAFLWWRFL